MLASYQPSRTLGSRAGFGQRSRPMNSPSQFLITFAALFWVSSLNASMWEDPEWPELLQSPQIILAEVVKGGRFIAKVKAIKTLKGKAPGNPFWFSGFNDRHMEEDGVKVGTFRNGEKLI